MTAIFMFVAAVTLSLVALYLWRLDRYDRLPQKPRSTNPCARPIWSGEKKSDSTASRCECNV